VCRSVKLGQFYIYIGSSSRQLFQYRGTGCEGPLTRRIEMMSQDVQKLHDAWRKPKCD